MACAYLAQVGIAAKRPSGRRGRGGERVLCCRDGATECTATAGPVEAEQEATETQRWRQATERTREANDLKYEDDGSIVRRGGSRRFSRWPANKARRGLSARGQAGLNEGHEWDGAPRKRGCWSTEAPVK